MNTRLAPSRSAASTTASAAGRPNTTRSIPVKTISPARMVAKAIYWASEGEGRRGRDERIQTLARPHSRRPAHDRDHGTGAGPSSGQPGDPAGRLGRRVHRVLRGEPQALSADRAERAGRSD